MSDFFPPPLPPKPETERPTPVWWAPPRDELGREVPERAILGSSDSAVVALLGFVVYSTGFTFRLLTLLREPLGLRRISPSFDTVDPNPLLKFAIEWPTGAILSSLNKTPAFNSQPDPPVLNSLGRSASSSEWRFYQEWWVWPLPPPGRVRLLCEWPQEGVARSGHEIDLYSLFAAGL